MSIARILGYGFPLALWLTMLLVVLMSIRSSFGLLAPFGMNASTSATACLGFPNENRQPRSEAFRKATTSSGCFLRNVLLTAIPWEAMATPSLFESRMLSPLGYAMPLSANSAG